MIITDKEIKSAIEALKSSRPVDLEYFNSDGFHAWVSPRTYFVIENEYICTKAIELNEKHGKDIFDRRTRGWKLIKEEYEKFISRD